MRRLLTTFSERRGQALYWLIFKKQSQQLDDVAQAINRQGGNAIAIVADATDDAEVDKMVTKL